MVVGFPQKTVRFFLASVFFLSAASLLQAYPRMGTMVSDIRDADLIVFGDISINTVVNTVRLRMYR